MKLTTVLSCVNDNPKYYQFIPYQIKFWRAFGIRFVAYFVGAMLPPELSKYQEHVHVWDHSSALNSTFVAQNLRLYAPALLSLPDDEMVMITDMDLLPMSAALFTKGLETFSKKDFVYYGDTILHFTHEIFMAYNAAHPTTWATLFLSDKPGDTMVDRITYALQSTYMNDDRYLPGSKGWFTDQHVLYQYALKYPHFQMLHRPIKRLETWDYKRCMQAREQKGSRFIHEYDDAHFHRDFDTHRTLIEDAEAQLDA